MVWWDSNLYSSPSLSLNWLTSRNLSPVRRNWIGIFVIWFWVLTVWGLPSACDMDYPSLGWILWIGFRPGPRNVFHQECSFDRILYFTPAKVEGDPSGFWKLLAAAHRLVDSGRLWYRTNHSALFAEYGLTKWHYEHTRYHHRKSDGTFIFLLVAQVYNSIYAG